MKLTLTALSIATALALFSCKQKEEQPQQQAASPPAQVQEQAVQAPPQVSEHPQIAADLHTGVVQEVLQANAYTYLKVKENDEDVWIAVTKRDIEPGKTITFSVSLEMKDFESKDLQRTFESIYFVDRVVGDEPAPAAAQQPVAMPHQGKPVMEQKELSIEPAEGGISIGELFSNRDAYADKTILIKGQVMKVNPAIMGKNWVHLQDGTSGSGSFDLTVTTQDEVAVGDVVTFEGKIALNRDFGAGYSYEVLMEEAKKAP